MIRPSFLAILLLAAALPATAQPGRPYDPNRLGGEQIAELVAGEEALLADGDVDGATALFERRLAAARNTHGEATLAVADLLEAYGAKLAEYASIDDRPELRRLALPYLARATALYRTLFGADHPEVAIALNSWAHVARDLDPDQPGPTEAALAEAYRIRLAALGPANAETIWTMLYLSDARGNPVMTGADPARAEAVAALLEQAIAASRGSDAQTAGRIPVAANIRRARIYLRHGQALRAYAALKAAAGAAPGSEAIADCASFSDVGQDLLADPAMAAAGPERRRLEQWVQDCPMLDPELDALLRETVPAQRRRGPRRP